VNANGIPRVARAHLLARRTADRDEEVELRRPARRADRGGGP